MAFGSPIRINTSNVSYDPPAWAPVEIRICQPDQISADAIRRRFPAFFHPDGDDFVFRSSLDRDASISDHLKWLYGRIKDERKAFRQFEASGVAAVICIRAQDRQFRIEPESLLLAHQFHLPIEVRLTK